MVPASSVAGICGGTLALARAGLLNDVAHTSNDLAFLEQFQDKWIPVIRPELREINRLEPGFDSIKIG